jgi:SMODS-associated and fused to various effectors sensor domain/CHAT domain
MHQRPPDDALLLLLDLAAENPIDATEIFAQLDYTSPPPVIRATEFGAVPSGRGWDSVQLQPWSRAIEHMLLRAREHLRPRTELLVAGRAGLGSFAELGLRLSSWHDGVTVLNQRKGERTWDSCSLEGGDPDAAPFFDEILVQPREGHPDPARGRVAVVVSTGDEVPLETIEAFFAEHREPLLGTITLRARPPQDKPAKLVTSANAPALARTLCVEFDKIRHAFRGQRGLAVFIAGPAQLAFLTGRAINPNVYRSVWFPHWRDGRYVMGARVPWLDTIRVRMLLASPSDLPPIDLTREEQVAMTALDRPLARDRIDLVIDQSATYHDLHDVLSHDHPHILHFSGHGNPNAVAFAKDGAGTRDAVSVDELVHTLRSASNPRDRPRLVILNACHSAAPAKALTQVVDFAIGMSDTIKNNRSIAFTRRFYDALARGRTLYEAFDQARAYLAHAPAAAGLLELCCREGCDPRELRFFEP